MNALPVLTVAPFESVLTLDMVKAHCRVDSSDDDVLLNALIHAVTSHLDGWMGILGRCLVTQDWKRDFDCWAVFELPLEPVDSVVAISYFDGSGNEQTVDPNVYQLQVRTTRTVVGCRADRNWPVSDFAMGPVSVTWRAGYGTANDVPQAIKQAMLLLIGHWYEQREGVVVGTGASELPMAVAALLAPFRKAVV